MYMPRRPIEDYDEHPEQEDLSSPDNSKKETKRDLELRKLKEQIIGLELKNKALEKNISRGEKEVSTKKKKPGPAEKYSKEFHPKLAKLFYSQGGIDREFAEYIGISEPTIHAWKKKHKEFRAAVRSGKLDPDMKVESALYSSAINDGSNTAQIFWLKNRRPERWKDVHKIDLKGELTAKNSFQIVDKDGNEVLPDTGKDN
jgi:hypothetical protein